MGGTKERGLVSAHKGHVRGPRRRRRRSNCQVKVKIMTAAKYIYLYLEFYQNWTVLSEHVSTVALKQASCCFQMAVKKKKKKYVFALNVRVVK